MAVKIILDPGSTHDGSIDKAKELIRIGAGSGADAIKWQLLGENETKAGNTLLPWAWLPELMDLGKSLGVEVFASVFNRAGAEWLYKCGCASIKFAYSQRLNLGWACDHKTVRSGLDFKRIYVSCDVMHKPDMVMPDTQGNPIVFDVTGASQFIHLYCVPEYPVPYIVDFEGLFPRFQGFSSHCLGVEQEIRAVRAGAKYLEFHYQGSWSSPCPDARFAKPPKLTEQLVREIRRMDQAPAVSGSTYFSDIPFKSAPAVPFSPDGLGIDHNE